MKYLRIVRDYLKLLRYEIKWGFHCLFKFHRQLTVWTTDDKFVGCYECDRLNDKYGNEYATQRT